MEEEATLHDITTYESFFPGSSYTWVWWILAVSPLLIFFIVFLWRKSRSNKAVELSPRFLESSLQSLAELEDSVDSMSLSLTAAEVSLALRTYLKNRFRSEALYQSHQEYTCASPLAISDDQLKEEVNTFLHQLWEREYTPSRIDRNASNELIKQAESLIQQIEESQQPSLAAI